MSFFKDLFAGIKKGNARAKNKIWLEALLLCNDPVKLEIELEKANKMILSKELGPELYFHVTMLRLRLSKLRQEDL